MIMSRTDLYLNLSDGADHLLAESIRVVPRSQPLHLLLLIDFLFGLDLALYPRNGVFVVEQIQEVLGY